MSLLLVVHEVLHAGGICVFRGQPLTGDAVRVVAPRAVVGRAPVIGETWRVEGRWQDHPAHGRQYAATTCAPTLPSGQLIVQALARSPRFPGVGSVRAQRLWDRHGMALFDLLDAGDATAFVPDIGQEQADALVVGWRAQAEEAATFRWLTMYEFEPRLARKVLDLYTSLPVPPDADAVARSKGRAIWHLEDDPYRMLAFASWTRVDRAAQRMGLRPDDPRRCVQRTSWCLSRGSRGSGAGRHATRSVMHSNVVASSRTRTASSHPDATSWSASSTSAARA